jgi:hypothetical protein
LLELAHPKNKVAGRNFIAERLADLAMPKGSFGEVESTTFLKFVNMACAVSGRR